MAESNQKRLKFNDNPTSHSPPAFLDEEPQPLFQEGAEIGPKINSKAKERS
jgi:hypothetical protein